MDEIEALFLKTAVKTPGAPCLPAASNPSSKSNEEMKDDESTKAATKPPTTAKKVTPVDGK
jgi:hypothetical protein